MVFPIEKFKKSCTLPENLVSKTVNAHLLLTVLP